MKKTLLIVAMIASTMMFSCNRHDDDDNKPSGNESSNMINGHEYVNLGLSVKWATCNVGASNPKSFGNYYAWGELNTKPYYSYDNCDTYYEELNDISGKPKYDVARNKWGKTWRIPTKAEMEELIYNCSWEYENDNGVAYYRIIGPSGNYIYLPVSGYYEYSYEDMYSGQYWTSTPDKTNDYSSNSYALIFDEDEIRVMKKVRYLGRTIRPVSE